MLTFDELISEIKHGYLNGYDGRRPVTVSETCQHVIWKHVTTLDTALSVSQEIARLDLPKPLSQNLVEMDSEPPISWLDFYRYLIDGVVRRVLEGDPQLRAVEDQRYEPVRRARKSMLDKGIPYSQ